MQELTYGFVDEHNILLGTAIVLENDSETIERIKLEYSASAAYPMNLEKEAPLPNSTFWGGERFHHPKPFESWIWSEENNDWIPPIPKPDDWNGLLTFYWDNESESWVKSPNSPTEPRPEQPGHWAWSVEEGKWIR